jgi:uncharacterized damage-inducible protein DinB
LRNLEVEATKLIEYTHAARRRYLETLKELPWEEVVRDRGASFPSLRDIFLHALNAEDLLVNYIIPGIYEKWATPDTGKFTDMSRVEQRVDEVEKQVNMFLASLTEGELNRKVTLPWRKDPPIVLRIEDVLINTAIEDASHMGELIALMWQFDRQPPFLSWSTFLEQG